MADRVTRAWRRTGGEGHITDDDYGRRLDEHGGLIVDLAEKVGVDERVGAVA